MNQASQIIAALGPTNTGKTFRATQRMMDHPSGMIGLPLRLLAREVHDRLVEQCGAARVALVTGEEKRVPRDVCYWVCTVEAMPLDVEVDFLAVDEIQLCAHKERGHVFTDRLLHARGRKETWFLGSDTMVPLVRRLVPTARVETHPRLSDLRAEGVYSLGRLPARSAVVAFSINRVYELAERIKVKRGGVGVVLGALSPRARNAQVAMYQAGEVDYLVATDAIGMGLNLDVDRVAFAELGKFDGQKRRELDVTELAQIAGRAGRYLKDGAFGTLAPLPRIDRELERRIETHRFDVLNSIQWRNRDLDFTSLAALVASLAKPPPAACLLSVHGAEDTRTLEKLARRKQVLSAVRGEAELRVLWEACQIPDYRKLLVDEHANLVETIFVRLVEHGCLDESWLEQRLTRLTEHPGDIETIMSRIAFCRTWTYVTGREGWVRDPRGWQRRARAIEERLSDDLHRALVERFVARRKRVAAPNFDDASDKDPRRRLAELKAQMELDPQEPAGLARILAAPVEALSIDQHGSFLFEGTRIGRLLRGRHLLEPRVEVLVDESSSDLRLLEQRLRLQTRRFVAELLAPLEGLHAEDASAAQRGLIYQMRQGLGSAMGSAMTSQAQALSKAEVEHLSRVGVVLGRTVAFAPRLLKPFAMARRRALVRAYLGVDVTWSLDRVSAPLPSSWRRRDSGQKRPSTGQRSSWSEHRGLDTHASLQTHGGSDEHRGWEETANALGFALIGGRLVRWDIAERVFQALSERPADPGTLVEPMMRWLGCSRAESRKLERELTARFNNRRSRKRRRRR